MMTITQDLLDAIKTHCTETVINCINISIDNESDNTWDIEEVVNNRGPLFHEKMKVAYVFEKVGGTLLYENKPEQYVIIAKRAADYVLEEIRLYWINNEANGVSPIYGFGKLIVPQILPPYSFRPNEEGKYVVERLVRGQYVEMSNEIYLTEEMAMERAKQLNTEL